jgi:UDP-glucose 4-epimerase
MPYECGLSDDIRRLIMYCVVTGGSGFIGSHVVDCLMDAGHKVRVIDYRKKPYSNDVEFADVDILNFDDLLNATQGCDIIFHLAAVSNINVAFKQPLYNVELNILGTAKVLEAARQNSIKRVILASTVWIYSGCHDNQVHEDSPFYMPGAGHIYTSSKIASELLCHDYWILYHQPFTILRYGIPYGPRMREELVIPTFIRKALNGEPLTITGDGSQHRSFLYVEELARAHVQVLQDKAINQTYNLEGMRPVTIREVAETVKKLVGENVDIQYLPARPGDYRGKVVSGTKAKLELGWEPQIDFEEGMIKTLKWYKEKMNQRD